jgi:hypothetical protein
LIAIFRRGKILKKVEAPITSIANMSINDVIKKMMSLELNVNDILFVFSAILFLIGIII